MDPNNNSTYSPMLTPAILDRKNSLVKTLKRLNGRELEHPPPDTYYIRRNTKLFNKYAKN
jgi:hypothetical protein